MCRIPVEKRGIKFQNMEKVFKKGTVDDPLTVLNEKLPPFKTYLYRDACTRVCATYGCTLKRSLYFHLFSSLKLCQMAQPCTRLLLNNLAKNLWSRYRGKRAGRSTKTKEANRTYKITQVNPRPKDHTKAKINLRGHEPSNCISITTKPQFTSVPEPQARNFVPSLFLSNVMSFATKIDEVSHVVQNAN